MTFLVLLACGDEPVTTPPPPSPVDVDRDGSPAGEDCDDADRDTFPGAYERCDGADQDCDGQIDEGYDLDGDGFLTGLDAGCAMLGPTDCDDGDAAINPDAEEGCDGIDNNCDTTIDDVYAATVGDAHFATLDDAYAVIGGSETMYVCPGDWTITGVVRNDDLTIEGVAGRDATRIMEASAGTVFTLTDAATFTLTGIDVTGSVADGIIVTDTATLRMIDSRVSGHQGTGIAANVAGAPTIELTGTEVVGNVSAGDGGGLALLYASNATLTNCSVTGNEAVNGGGIFASPAFGAGGVITLDGTTLDGNTAAFGAGIHASQTTVLGLNGATVSNNVASADGGGLALFDAPVDGVLVTGNAAVRGGGVAALYDATYDTAPLHSDLTAVIVDSNTADQGAGIWVGNRETVNIDAASAVTLNTATQAGGGAALTGALANLTSADADWGSDGVDDNAPDDVNTTLGGTTYEGTASFTCNGVTGCL